MQARLAELEDLRKQGIISEDEYQEARANTLGIRSPAAANKGEAGAVEGAIVAQPVPSATAATTPIFKCREGHHMKWTNDGSQEGQLCRCCFRKTGRGDYYFNCPVCTVTVCHECGSNGAEANALSILGAETGWQTGLCECTDFCYDSYFCFYCLMEHNSVTMTKGITIRQDGGPPKCECNCSNFFWVQAYFWMDLLAPATGLQPGFASSLTICTEHQRMQELLSIPEKDRYNSCSSYMLANFCRCCVVQQMSAEYAKRGLYLGGVCVSKPPSGYTPPRPLAPMGDDAAAAFMAQAPGNGFALPPPPPPSAPQVGTSIY